MHRPQPVVSKVSEDQLHVVGHYLICHSVLFQWGMWSCSLEWTAIPLLASPGGEINQDGHGITFAGEMRADVYDLERVIDDYREVNTQFTDEHLPGLVMCPTTSSVRRWILQPVFKNGLDTVRLTLSQFLMRHFLTSSVSIHPRSHLAMYEWTDEEVVILRGESNCPSLHNLLMVQLCCKLLLQYSGYVLPNTWVLFPPSLKILPRMLTWWALAASSSWQRQ